MPNENQQTPGEPIRRLALKIALRGVEEAAREASPSELERASAYLANLATTDGRVALGGVLLVLQQTIERATENGADKIVIDAAARYAELAKLADFSAVDVAARAERSEREARAVEYLESSGAIPKGLDLLEAARLTAQYIVDEIKAKKSEPATDAAKSRSL